MDDRARCENPNYENEFEEGERKKNAKLILQNKLKSLIDGPLDKREQFLQLVNQIKTKKNLVAAATDIKQINR